MAGEGNTAFYIALLLGLKSTKEESDDIGHESVGEPRFEVGETDEGRKYQ